MASNANGKDTGMSKGTTISVAAAAAAAIAAAAGAYWFYGAEDAGKHRKSVRSFMLKARADVLDAVEKMKDIDKSSYLAIVERVVAKYSSVAGVTTAEVAQMTRDLKAAWEHMKAVHDSVKPAVLPAAKKVVKKAAPKKAAPKKQA